MAAVNCLYVAAASTAASAAVLQWWASSLLEGEVGAGGDGDWLGAVLRSRVTVALLANLAAHVFLVLLLALKMFQSLARERLEQLNASPSATPSKYFRVYSALLLVLSADLLWMKFCVGFCSSCNSKLFWLLFFEPLSIAFDTLQSIMVHGFQLFDIWQRHLMESGADFLDFQKSYKQAAGSFTEWRGKLTRNFGFAIDLISLLMSLGHYSMIFWLRGMAFHLVDAVLLLNLRALVVSFLKRIKTYIKLRKALRSLDGALPDATYDEICAYDDECAICRGPMARAKKLSCNHLFHLACLRSWLDQGLMEGYSCPTCRRPLSVSSEGHTRPTTLEVANVQRIAEQLTMGLNQHRVPGNEHPVEQPNPSDAVWRGAGLDASWVPPWSSPVMDNPSSSSAVRSVGLTGVQMMMRQLASVTDNYGHADGTWNLWPEPMAGSSLVPSTSSIPDNASAVGLRLRGTAGTTRNGSLSEVLTMVDRVREVLPHIPDELIIEDLMRTNNINATVNNLLLMQ
ncbi:E3 ubiquitin protein ligase RIN2 [Dichanthelium oligosanthes]|uniref:RING-type E3 ubiquitin transferase n=1 Tax=Dichanthelium oligosanthes TaxID=888268 RepID=A0A1E5VIF4_9POAL|nr:E3 ubiquitin protein ligase RIN2 [Dichanthelium oligosanthes]